MSNSNEITETLFDDEKPFLERAQFAYRYQVVNNPIYRVFASHFFGENQQPDSVAEIPLMPIRAFKELELIAEGKEPELTFKSSGTGSMSRSRHLVADSWIYRKAIQDGFNEHFDTEFTTILCYAPGYSDNPDSSLLWMLNHLIENDPIGLSQFLPLGQPLKKEMFEELYRPDRTIVLFGAAFGLLDLIDLGSSPLPKTAHIIETGGMKTYRREMSKQELRNELSDGFNLPKKQIHSEYGMCELLSQMYAIGSEWLTTPHWMHASIRDPEDPTRRYAPEIEGKIGIIDLANIYSCPFILTEDRGVADEEGRISVSGRWNPADLRGCNFLIDRD